MKYQISLVFSDHDTDWGWPEHLAKLKDILTHLASIHPRMAEWYVLQDSPDTSYQLDLIRDTAHVAQVLHQKKARSVRPRVLFWNGKWSGDPNIESDVYEEWVSGTYAAGSASPVIKNTFNLEMHPLPGATSPVQGFIDVMLAVDQERTLTTGAVFSEGYMAHRVFPHRRWGGWMAYVPARITLQDIPQAAEVIDARNGGSIVVTTHDLFDDKNAEHVRRANEIEIRLVELGLLPEM